MDDIKKRAEDYLRSDRSLPGGRELYNQLPGKSLAMQRYISRMTGSEKDLQVLHYEIAKAVGIPERGMKIMLSGKPQKPAAHVQEENKMEIVQLTAEEQLFSIKLEELNYHDALALLKELGIKASSRKKDAVFATVKEARESMVSKIVSELPIEVKASIKMREQFPFLKEKECPDALKILVNDMISSRERFVEEQPKLHALLNEAEEKQLVDIVLEEYINNKEAWDELEHYNTTGEILGKHPIFEMIAAKDEISALNTVELAKKIKNLKINIGKNKSKGNEELVQRDEELLSHASSVLEKR